MKLTEKQLTIIFCAILALFLLGYYIFSSSPKESAPPPPEAAEPTVKGPTLSGAEDARLKEMLSEKSAPLQKEDVAAIKQIMKEDPPEPLSESDQAVLNNMLGI